MAIRTLGFQLTLDSGAPSVRLTTDSGECASAPFQLDLSAGARVSRVIDELPNGTPRHDDLRDVGSQLFRGLVDGPVAELFARVWDSAEPPSAAPAQQLPDSSQVVIRLAVPPALQHLPWECLYDEERTGFLFARTRCSLVRETSGIRAVPRAPRRSLPVSMLVVIPQGSNLSVEGELHRLKVAVSRLGDAIALERLDGHVTPDRLRKKIDAGQWDIVHFIGHGDVVDGVSRVRLNDDNPADDVWLDGDVFSTFVENHVPRLIVLNCCFGGSGSPKRTLSGLGPFLMRAGVPAVVAMQYEIPDDVAIKFADSFYGELLGGAAPGRIDVALASARRTLYQNQRPDTVLGFITPVLYLIREHERIFDLAAAQRPVTVVAAPPPSLAPQPMPVPDELIEALRDRRCVPVVGPEILKIGAVRGAPAPLLGPRELALRLAAEAGYPEMDDLQDVNHGPEPAAVRLLPAVCQHYERQNQRYKLLMAVQRAYQDAVPPPAVEAIAGWEVPGIICAYFDGLVEDAMTLKRRTFRSLTRVDQKAAGYQGELLIVHLRGVFKEAESLVLTERDHELLFDRLGRMSSDITDLTRKRVGLSLLYLGVSPRDPLIRRLTRALSGGAQGPVYFCHPDHTAVDDAYWEPYNVHWLAMKLPDLLPAIAEAATAVRLL